MESRAWLHLERGRLVRMKTTRRAWRAGWLRSHRGNAKADSVYDFRGFEVAVLIEAGSANETLALDIANGVRHGLVAAVFTDYLEAAITFAGNLETGLAQVNAATSGVDFHAPVEGSKDSGIGLEEQGLAALDYCNFDSSP